MISFNKYQEVANSTAIYPSVGGLNFVYPVMGLAGEAGEVSEKFKKIIRDNNGVISEKSKNEIIKELGDVLWYVSQIATELGVSLQEVAETNASKLSRRAENNTLQGDGDNR